ncbi:MAG: hypothetical protein J6T72_02505 [Alphaproteobacteria bacterium]|nr:hypothetical protein [Alphaproteobacteria bacterium]
MNFKTILLGTAAATLIAGVANAKDFTGSLFLPSKGEILSSTSLGYERQNEKYGWHNEYEDFVATEELTYGVTDNFAIYGRISNNFDFARLTDREYNNDHNFAYALGAKYNHNFGKILTQVGAEYYTMQAASWWGHKWMDSEWTKAVEVEAQVGYDMGHGTTPYIKATASSLIDTRDRDMDYSVFAGVHQTLLCGKMSADAGVRYEFTTDRNAAADEDWGWWFDQNNANNWYLQAEVNYFVTDNVAVGVFGDYFLHGSRSKYVDYDYTAGVNLKVLF